MNFIYSHIEYGYWIVGGLLLMAMEMLLPGAFFLWIGLTALIVGCITWLFPISLVTQLLIFSILVPLVTWLGKSYFKKNMTSDAPLLNLKIKQMVGKTLILSQPIIDGKAQVIMGDSVWQVEGPDLPAGTHVKITDIRGNILIVKVLS